MSKPMRYRVEHRNAYRYAEAVGLNFVEARLLPRPTPTQRVLEARLDIAPAVDELREREDAYGNRVVWFSLHQPHQALTVTARCLLQRDEAAPATGAEPMPWEAAVEAMNRAADAETRLAREFCLASPRVPIDDAFTAYVRASFPPGRPLAQALADLATRVRAEFAYRPMATDLDTPLTEVLEARHGVCQDFAHLCIAGLRGLGLATRYVSGWLETTPAPDEAPRLGADASHAWIAVYAPGAGWLDFDPTNGGACGPGHLTLAWGRDYDDVVPLKGVIFGAGAHGLEVGVTVTRLADADPTGATS